MSLKVKADLGPAGHALGIASGIAQTVETDAYIADLVRIAADKASRRIETTIDQQARGNAALNHVYEWNMAGVPGGRLFNIYPKGRGRNQVVTFAFTASKMPIPTVQQREKAGEILPVPTKIKERLNPGGRKYVFRQKAQIMEYGGTTNIAPRGHAKIFIPFSEIRRDSNGRSMTYTFADSATVNFAQSKSKGQFSAAFLSAQAAAGAVASAEVERAVQKGAKDLNVRAGKTRAKTFSVGFSQGQDYARNRMKLAASSLGEDKA